MNLTAEQIEYLVGLMFNRIAEQTMARDLSGNPQGFIAKKAQEEIALLDSIIDIVISGE